MMRKTIFLFFSVLCCLTVRGQQVTFTETAPLRQVYGAATESQGLLPMNDLDMGERGYVLYSAEVSLGGEEATLRVENVRDYAAVYLDGVLLGSLTDGQKELQLPAAEGTHRLDLYAENIGRITYGPEILDNYRGLFGEATLDGEAVEGWTITPLDVRGADVKGLAFSEGTDVRIPCFYKGFFEIDRPGDTYLDVSGWGMGEVWVNGQYMGSFWEEENQQSILLSADCLVKGRNEVVVFELKNNGCTTMTLSDSPVFK